MSEKSYYAFGRLKYLAKKIILISKNTMTLEKALTKTQDEDEVFIAGGLSLFQQTLPFVQGVYMNRIHRDFVGEVHYPQMPKELKLQYIQPYEQDPEVALHYYERKWDYES